MIALNWYLGMIGLQLNTVQSLHCFLNPQEHLFPSRSLADYTICSVIYLECLFTVSLCSSFFSNLHWYQYSTLPTATFTWIVSWKPQMETRQEGLRNLLQRVEREWAVELKDDCHSSWFVRSKRKRVWSSAPLLLSPASSPVSADFGRREKDLLWPLTHLCQWYG